VSPTVFLHIGAPKTGTTYLQDRLGLNTASLASHDVHFPGRSALVSPALFHFRAALDLGRQVPAAWQESIKQGRRWRYSTFVQRMERGRTWFSRAFDLPAVLGRWGAHVPPEHVHLVTVPPSGSSRPGDDLWHRFCRVVGIDPEWAPEQSTRANASLGVAEAAVLRRLNRQLDRATRREAAYDGLIRSMLAEDVLVNGGSARITLPPTAYDWVDRTTSTWIEWIEQSGVDVVGDVEELRPQPPDPDGPWRDPDQVPAWQRSRVAVNALAAMTVEAARRPDPGRTLRGRVRQGAGRLKPW